MIIRASRLSLPTCLLPKPRSAPRTFLWRSIDLSYSSMTGPKRPFSGSGGNLKFQNKRNKKSNKPIEEGSNDAVLLADVKNLLSKHKQTATPYRARGIEIDDPAPVSGQTRPERFSEIEITIAELSSTGEGLGLSSSSLDHYQEM